MLINPAFGNSFNFPMRDQNVGLDDNSNEFMVNLAEARIQVYLNLSKFRFVDTLVQILRSEDGTKHFVTKVSVFRILNELTYI